MKKQLILSIAIVSFFTSCKKEWLEIVPQGRQVAVTLEDYDKLMNNPANYYFSSGGFQEAQLMGDEVAAETPFFTNFSVVGDALFQWKDSIYKTVSMVPPTIYSTFPQVYEINKIINEVMSAESGTDRRKKEVRAEALATRAFNLFMMVNYYCKPYNGLTATVDPGFPIIKDADVTQQVFSRGTLQQTYDFIINDLKEALLDIPLKQSSLTRMSKPAVEGLLGKVYLFMARYSDALPYLESALQQVTSNGQTSLYDYNIELLPGGSFLPVDQNYGPASPGQLSYDVKEAVVSKVFYSGANNGSLTGNDGLVLTPEAAMLYGSNDLRLMFYTDRNPDNSVNAAGRIRKYGVNYSRFGLQLSELYLLNAECKARLNNLSGAVADLETLRKKRIRTNDDSGSPISDALVPSSVATNQTSLIRFIIEERIREFAMEGYRWFDMRRLSLDPIFAGSVYTHTMYNEDGSTAVYTLNQPNRLVLQLPRYITEFNPGMINNP